MEQAPDASNALHIPSADSMLSLLNCSEVVGRKSKLEPATIAESHCPVRIAINACCRPNKLLEHAVSIA